MGHKWAGAAYSINVLCVCPPTQARWCTCGSGGWCSSVTASWRCRAEPGEDVALGLLTSVFTNLIVFLQDWVKLVVSRHLKYFIIASLKLWMNEWILISIDVCLLLLFIYYCSRFTYFNTFFLPLISLSIFSFSIFFLPYIAVSFLSPRLLPSWLFTSDWTTHILCWFACLSMSLLLCWSAYVVFSLYMLSDDII